MSARNALSMMSRFAASGFEPVEYEGLTVHPMLRLDPRTGDQVLIDWVSAASPREQGLGLRLRNPDVPGPGGYGGVLRVAEAESPAIMIWQGTAPPRVTVDCVEVQDRAELRISNRWRLDDGREDEWLNNYGMLIDERGPNEFILRCSDGFGPTPSFDDLVVRVQLVRASEDPEG